MAFPADPVIEAYKKDVDVSLLIENLRRTPSERLLAIMRMAELIDEMRRGMRNVAPVESSAQDLGPGGR